MFGVRLVAGGHGVDRWLTHTIDLNGDCHITTTAAPTFPFASTSTAAEGLAIFCDTHFMARRFKQAVLHEFNVGNSTAKPLQYPDLPAVMD